jgi:hypothetical protein
VQLHRWLIVSQTGVAVPEQSEFATHWTHCALGTSHFGSLAGHWESLVHPGRHWNSPGSQTGAAVPQSLLLRQATQVPFRTRQRGSPAGQSLFVAQETHCLEVAEHTGRVAGQSFDELHPTQTPLAVSQIGES